MAEINKLLQPVKYFNGFISHNVRPDRRTFDEHRSIKLNVGSITSADSSAVVKCGNTSVICGIKLELAAPKPEEPEKGFLFTNVELIPLCSSKFRPGPPSDYAQVISNIVADIVKNSDCIELKDLCIVPDKLAWVLYCDIICTDNDGSLVDACMIALMASLKTLLLPTATYDPETEDITVDVNKKTALKVNGLPVATSFAIYPLFDRCVLLSDPSAYEEDMCGGHGANLIICWNKGFLCGTHKFGGGTLSSEDEKSALTMAKQRVTLIEALIDTCIKRDMA